MRLTQWFIPDAIKRAGGVEFQRATLVVRFALGVGAFTLAFSIPLFAVGAPTPAIYNLVISSLICVSPTLMRVTGSLDATCHTLLFLIVTALAGESAMNGGLISPTTPILIVALMVAVFLLERRGGIIWTALVVLTLIGLFAADKMGVEFKLHVDPEHVPPMRLAAYASMMIAGLVILLQYDSAKRRALNAMQEANTRITRMIVHVENTSSALSRSAAEFLGSELGNQDRRVHAPHHLGLTQQMMTTASSSRHMMEGVGDSIHGMIRQYKHISRRIHELHKQSSTIAELVKSIDSISNRLDLMALNTGIEAAHAGEAGRRFQLLAEDMRRLSERVSTETLQIKSVIRRVQRHTDAAIEASLTGHALTDAGVTKLESMSRAFDEMHQLIERTAEASKRITQDTEVQITAIHELATTSQRTPDRTY